MRISINAFLLSAFLLGCSSESPDLDAFHDAINCGRAREVTETLAKHPNLLTSEEATEYDLLSMAISDCPEVVGLLLENGADPNQSDASGELPLETAINYGQQKCINLLLEHGAELSHGQDKPSYLEMALEELYYENDDTAALEKIRDILIEKGCRITQAKDLGVCPNGTALIDIPVVGEFDIEEADVAKIKAGELLMVEDGKFLVTHPFSPESQWHFEPMNRQWKKHGESTADFKRAFHSVIAEFDIPNEASTFYQQIIQGEDLVESYVEIQVNTMSYDELIEHCRDALARVSVEMPDDLGDSSFGSVYLDDGTELDLFAHPNPEEDLPTFRMTVTASDDKLW